ncbi:hypothetical protein C3Y98_00920 [Methylotenera oryzisoli]|uniref:Uncharacterized protein n=1 Tax=Methylotenera oryzisoli TaxID=2080758 RepID=A0A4Y9VTK8_9PROT|nr:hypothetical protein [Methylotenera oryzisoli]TFW72953.1 hypothetical protein C3Y98_00920 [Methylotenera oryzisoli]
MSTGDFLANTLSVLILFFMLCPSLIKLIVLGFKRVRGLKINNENYKTGVTIHVINTFVSPGFPLYLFFKASQCGPGCGSGIVFIFLLPITYGLFFFANSYIEKAFKENKEYSA